MIFHEMEEEHRDMNLTHSARRSMYSSSNLTAQPECFESFGRPSQRKAARQCLLSASAAIAAMSGTATAPSTTAPQQYYRQCHASHHSSSYRRSSLRLSPLLILVASLLLLVFHDSVSSCNNYLFVQAEKDSNPYPYGENPNTVFKMYWNDAGNVMQDLSKFSALFIRYHGCVWSECQVDSFDDDGENRDGDEYWYQYRTQPFCANAAYSLYGTLRNASPLSSIASFSSCSRGTYINSFFTYGGSDTIVKALSLKTGSTPFDSMSDGSSSNSHANSVCYVVDEGNNNGGSDGSSSTMGCSADNQFVVAEFGGTTCDGNYFIQTLEKLNQYNHAMNGVHCKQIWNYNRHYKNSVAYLNDQQGSSGNRRRRRNLRRLNNNDDQSSSAVTYNSPAENLLANSWACDISIYPKGCPDPYKLKKKYDSVLKSVAAGRSSRVVVTHARLQRPLSILASIALGIGICFGMVAYTMTNKSRFQKNGVIPVLCGDLKIWLGSLCKSIYDSLVWCCAGCWAMFAGIARKLRKKRKLEKAQRKEERRKEKLLKKQKKKARAQSGSMSDTSSNARRQRAVVQPRSASTSRAMTKSRKRIEEELVDADDDSPDRRTARRSKSSANRLLPSRDRRKHVTKWYHGMEESDPKQRYRGSFAELNSSNEDSYRSDVV